MSQPDEQTFAAAPSHGWIWPLLLGVFGLVLVVTAMVPETPSWGQLAIGGLLTVLGLVTAFAGSRVTYAVSSTQLHMSAFPLVNDVVPVSEIRSISRVDLQPTVWASIRFPGLALRRVRYVDVGPVSMCATRAASDILLLETDRGRFGVTPRDETAFIEALSRAGVSAGG
ncbi:MAG: hypothetical protein KDB30_09430 [Tetrasphaera sp.]|jgi:hypothetical protein|uniref:PH domain-containing protein n=1 Tax=Phycicoccus sp. TaxID=1902410 RepID=UPI001D26C103|nr:hypothetical protein [Tetrasphaera sp.]HPJ19566.1 PH domain-containing protein [Actinomycetota bacterium]